MPNIIKSIGIAVLLSGIFLVQTASALLGDGGSSSGPCIYLSNTRILSYGQNDAHTNGEVTILQSFLHDNGYLVSNPTGFFGTQTRNAVRAFQAVSFTGVQANDIDSTIITSTADREELAATGFVLDTPGRVGMYTRAKIAYLSCLGGGNISDTGNNGNGNAQAGATDVLSGPATCTVPTYIVGGITNGNDAYNGACPITLNWTALSGDLSSKVLSWQLDGSTLWSGNLNLGDTSLASKSKTFSLGQSPMTVVLSADGQQIASKKISGVCASGASRDSSGKCVTTNMQSCPIGKTLVGISCMTIAGTALTNQGGVNTAGNTTSSNNTNQTTFVDINGNTCASSIAVTRASAQSKGVPFITSVSYANIPEGACSAQYYDVHAGDRVTLYGERLAGSTVSVAGTTITPVFATSGSVQSITFTIPSVLRSGVSVDSVIINNDRGGAMAPYIKIHATCTSWTYSQYGACQSNGTKVRTITSATPMFCTGGNPEPLVASCASTTSSGQAYDPTFTTFTAESLASRAKLTQDLHNILFYYSLTPKVGDKANWGNGIVTRLTNGHLLYDEGNNILPVEIWDGYDIAKLAVTYPLLNQYFGKTYGINVAPTDGERMGASANAYGHISVYGLGSNFTEQNPFAIGNSATGPIDTYKDTSGNLMFKTPDGNFVQRQFEQTNYFKAIMDGGTTNGLTDTQLRNRAWPLVTIPTTVSNWTSTAGSVSSLQSCTGTHPQAGNGVVLYDYSGTAIGPSSTSNTIWTYGAGSCGWTCTSPMIQDGNTGCKNPTPGTGVTITIKKLDGSPISGARVSPSTQLGILNGLTPPGSPFTTDSNGTTQEFWFSSFNTSGEWTTMGIDAPNYKISDATTGCTPDVRVNARKQVNYCLPFQNAHTITIVMVPGDISTTPVITWSKSVYYSGDTVSGSIVGGDPKHTWGCMDNPNTAYSSKGCLISSLGWRQLTLPYDGHADEWQFVENNGGDSLQLASMSIAGYPTGTYNGDPRGKYTMYVRTGTSALDNSGTMSSASFELRTAGYATNPQASQVLGASASNISCVDIPRNLIRGTESAFVTSLQSFLIKKGFLVGPATGFLGDKTVEAIMDYQVSKGLPVTGMVYEATRATIKSETCR